MSQFRRFLKKEWIIPSAVGVVSFSAGITTGYIIGRRRRFKDISRRLESVEERQTEDASGFAQAVQKLKEDFKAGPIFEDTGLRAPQPHPEYLEKLERRERDREAFAHSDVAQWDYEEEVAKRTPGKPYIIHVDEFMSREKEDEDFRQTTLTYYRGDDVLLDERDVPLYDHDKIVGKENLIFGHGSNDPSIVYIRNEVFEAEYEILLEEGRYAIEVLGADVEDEPEIEHSRKRKKKLRED